MRSAEPIAVVGLFPELRHHLLELLAALSDEQWQRPTVCPGWSVKDVALHLLGGDIGNLARRRDGMGDAIAPYVPPGADLSAPATLVTAVNAWNEDWVVATRRMSVHVVHDLLAVTGDALYTYYGGLNLMAIGSPVSWVGPEPAPVWLDIAREYTEQLMHQAQIRDAAGIPGIRAAALRSRPRDIYARPAACPARCGCSGRHPTAGRDHRRSGRRMVRRADARAVGAARVRDGNGCGDRHAGRGRRLAAVDKGADPGRGNTGD